MNSWCALVGAIGLMAAALPAAAQSAQGKDFMATNQFLTDGQFMVAPNKAFFAIQQGDGNLCVYKGSGPADNKGALWCHMKHGGTGKFFAIQQGDGNLCTYRGTGPADNKGNMWCHMKHGASGAYFTAIQNDGNLCTYKGTGPADNKGNVWCSGVTAVPVVNVPLPTVGAAPPAYVKQFAPILVFASGSEGYGYPMSAQVYRDAMKNPATKYPLENKDKASLGNGSIPTYYAVRKQGNQIRIQYWFYYGYQHPCTGSQGLHHGDWENIIVILTENAGNIAAVRFAQHDAFYTRISGPRDAPCTPGGIGRCGGSGGFEKRGTHPVVYVGRVAHGSYHNTFAGIPGPGACTYYGDARGGGPEFATEKNLVDLDGKSEAWLDEDRAGGWVWGPDGVSTHPTKAVATGPLQSCKGSPAYDFGAAASAYNNGPGCFYNECLSGDDQAAERCIKECKSGYSNVGLTCNKGVLPWEWSIYGRLDSGNWYHYGYTIPSGDAGLSRRRNNGGEWNLP